MNKYAYDKVYDYVLDNWESLGFETQDEAIEWLAQHLVG